MFHLRRMIVLVFVFSLFPGISHGRKLSATNQKFAKPVRAELREMPHMSVWMDIKTLQASKFFAGITTNNLNSLAQSIMDSPCATKLKLEDIDQILMLGSDTEDPDKERAYMAFTGNLDATNLLKCLSVEKKWGLSTVHNYPVYHEITGKKKTIHFAVGPRTVVVVSGEWTNRIIPGRGDLGAGKVDGFSTPGQAMFVDVNQTAKTSNIRELAMEMVVGTNMDIAGTVTFRNEKDAEDLVKQIEDSKKQGITAGFGVVKSLKYKRQRNTVTGSFSMTPAEFTLAASLISGAGKKPAPSSPRMKTTPNTP